MAMHKPNVFIDLSGWNPKYFPPQIVRYASSQLGHNLIAPEKWKAFDEAGFRPEPCEPILKGNAAKLLFGNGAAPAGRQRRRQPR